MLFQDSGHKLQDTKPEKEWKRTLQISPLNQGSSIQTKHIVGESNPEKLNSRNLNRILSSPPPPRPANLEPFSSAERDELSKSISTGVNGISLTVPNSQFPSLFDNFSVNLNLNDILKSPDWVH